MLFSKKLGLFLDSLVFIQWIQLYYEKMAFMIYMENDMNVKANGNVKLYGYIFIKITHL